MNRPGGLVVVYIETHCRAPENNNAQELGSAAQNTGHGMCKSLSVDELAETVAPVTPVPTTLVCGNKTGSNQDFCREAGIFSAYCSKPIEVDMHPACIASGMGIGHMVFYETCEHVDLVIVVGHLVHFFHIVRSGSGQPPSASFKCIGSGCPRRGLVRLGQGSCLAKKPQD